MFKDYLSKSNEIGFVSEVRHYFVIVQGLPNARINEEVVFESGDTGIVFSLQSTYIEVILLTQGDIHVKSQVTRTKNKISVPVSSSLLGKHINAYGTILEGDPNVTGETREIDVHPPVISSRSHVDNEFVTGVALVDALIPLGQGQRELVLGDRKTGKTSFLFQTMLHQAKLGVVCIYACVGKKASEVSALNAFIKEKGIQKNCMVISSFAADSPGLIYLTPYSAMTIAEYFRDTGQQVLVIMDDLSTHANVYREISLIARRFPGRSGYPGDIFFIHSRLMERAGNFMLGNGKTASITCLPVAQTALGDITSFVTTNLMSMTDGHIYFDSEYFDRGRRPAVNPFTSVTRVGLQAQSQVAKEITRRLSAFLVDYERIQNFLHFGSEIGQNAKDILKLGDQFVLYFDQSLSTTISKNVNLYTLLNIWAGVWRGVPNPDFKKALKDLLSSYEKDQAFRTEVDSVIQSSPSFDAALLKIKPHINTYGR